MFCWNSRWVGEMRFGGGMGGLGCDWENGEVGMGGLRGLWSGGVCEFFSEGRGVVGWGEVERWVDWGGEGLEEPEGRVGCILDDGVGGAGWVEVEDGIPSNMRWGLWEGRWGNGCVAGSFVSYGQWGDPCGGKEAEEGEERVRGGGEDRDKGILWALCGDVCISWSRWRVHPFCPRSAGIAGGLVDVAVESYLELGSHNSGRVLSGMLGEGPIVGSMSRLLHGFDTGKILIDYFGQRVVFVFLVGGGKVEGLVEGDEVWDLILFYLVNQIKFSEASQISAVVIPSTLLGMCKPGILRLLVGAVLLVVGLNLYDDDIHDPDPVTRISKLDISDPLHLHSKDTTALTIVLIKLKGTENYQVWSCSMLLTLEGKNKISFIDSFCKRSNIDENGSSMADYYHKLNALWKQYDAMIELSKCVCNASEGFKKHYQLLKLMQFLMGLDDSYMQIRSSILYREVLLDVISAYATISSEESHRVAVGSLAGPLRPNNFNNTRQGGGSGMNNNSNGKIIDSWANQHMTYTDKELDNFLDISHLRIKVGHPNGTEAYILKIGNLRLSNGLTLYDVMVIPEYRVTLIYVHKLVKENKVIVAFDENRCYFLNQDLNLKNVLEIGKQCEGLYYYNEKDSEVGKNDSTNVFQDVNHINFFDIEYPEIPNDDQRLANDLNKGKSDSSSSSVSGSNVNTADFPVDSGNDADSSNDLLPLRIRRSSGEIDRYKARLVAQRFGQKEGIDYEETFSPVVKMVIVRCLLNIVVSMSWLVFQLDVNNAFLYGDLEEVVFMKPPEGYFPSDNKVCRLKKSLYGLKQAPRQWNAKLTSTLIENGFSQSKSDYSLYTKSDKGVFLALLVYVDDIIITGNSVSEIEKFKVFLKSKSMIKDLGKLKYFLGIKVVDTDKGICLNQRKYVLDLLSEYGMLACKPAKTPLMSKLVISNEASDKDPLLENITDYQKLIGKYLKSCSGLGVHVTKTSGMFLTAYSDADWAKCIVTRKSVTSNSAIKIAANQVFYERTKHLEIDLYFVRKKVLKGVVKTIKVDSTNQIVDILTKGLDTVQHLELIKNLGMYDVYQVYKFHTARDATKVAIMLSWKVLQTCVFAHMHSPDVVWPISFHSVIGKKYHYCQHIRVIWTAYYFFPLGDLSWHENDLAVNEFLRDSWKKITPNSSDIVGMTLLKSLGIFTQTYWYWIAVAASNGYMFLFNNCFTLALEFLDPFGSPRVVLSEDSVAARTAMKTGQSNELSARPPSERKNEVLIESSKASYVGHINNYLGEDSFLKKFLPIVPLTNDLSELAKHRVLIWRKGKHGGTAGKGCFKYGSLDHIARDCTWSPDAKRAPKYTLKDDGFTRKGGNDSSRWSDWHRYHMEFEEDPALVDLDGVVELTGPANPCLVVCSLIGHISVCSS
ncbi:ribonuclease H-like domain-containing protein [Tanacetum coccineum]|uniref:Ribonuclease H-like domain-containing protein n=1 Tax=Tanacetum coccineum TaxID=301880 RepID=A0ABQ5FHI5_9ASTR